MSGSSWRRITLIGWATGALLGGVVAMPVFRQSDNAFVYLLLGPWYFAEFFRLNTREWVLGLAAVIHFGVLGGIAARLLALERSKARVCGVLLLIVGLHLGATLLGASRFSIHIEGPLPAAAMPDISRESPNPGQ